jgi:serine/threonine protein phosphatase PrpC
VLHEIKNSNVGDVLLCGVLDGHGGTAASDSVSKILPPLFSEELELSDVKGHKAITEALEKSWFVSKVLIVVI